MAVALYRVWCSLGRAVDSHWKKWLARFRNLLLALAVDNARRQRALLLHYAGGSVNEMFETLPNTDAGEDENAFERAVTALTNYFTPGGIHIRDKKIPALLMENLAMDVENKTSMQTQKS